MRLASEGGLQVIFGLGAFERHGKPPDVGKMAPGGCRGPTRITRCNALGKSIVCIGLIEVGYRIWHDIVTLPHAACRPWPPMAERSEEHTSELQSLMRISYAVFCLKKKTHNNNITNN